MSARYERVLATRVPDPTYRALCALAREDDRPLSAYVRRALVQLAETTAPRDNDRAQTAPER